MEDYEVTWTPGAIIELNEILAYIMDDRPQSAERVQSAILTRVANLARFPEIGAVYRARGHRTARQVTYKKYRIFYRVIEEARRVEVLSVWHGARREPPLP